MQMFQDVLQSGEGVCWLVIRCLEGLDMAGWSSDGSVRWVIQYVFQGM